MIRCDHHNSSDCPNVCCRHRMPHKETKKPEPHYGCTEPDTCMGTATGVKIVVRCVEVPWKWEHAKWPEEVFPDES